MASTGSRHFAGPVALVTGGGRGTGREIAIDLAARSWPRRLRTEQDRRRDVAQAVGFLLDSEYVSGKIGYVDGGPD